MNRWIAGKKCYEITLPAKESFYSNLNLENISDEGYLHARKVWVVFAQGRQVAASWLAKMLVYISEQGGKNSLHIKLTTCQILLQFVTFLYSLGSHPITTSPQL